MPKKKTNRTAFKKFRVTKSGNVKRAQANITHNTGKKASKRMRRLRKNMVTDATNLKAVAGMLPYLGVKTTNTKRVKKAIKAKEQTNKAAAAA